MDTLIQTEKSPNFECKYCDYRCFKNSDMNKHLLTKKHINREKEYKMDTKNTTPKIHICDCGKEYLYHSGLWKHKKICNSVATKSLSGDKSESRFSDQYNKLIIEAMGGKGDNDLEKEDKIIKNIAKEVTIEK